jgi:hypothetical protein
MALKNCRQGLGPAVTTNRFLVRQSDRSYLKLTRAFAEVAVLRWAGGLYDLEKNCLSEKTVSCTFKFKGLMYTDQQKLRRITMIYRQDKNISLKLSGAALSHLTIIAHLLGLLGLSVGITPPRYGHALNTLSPSSAFTLNIEARRDPNNPPCLPMS